VQIGNGPTAVTPLSCSAENLSDRVRHCLDNKWEGRQRAGKPEDLPEDHTRFLLDRGMTTVSFVDKQGYPQNFF